MRIPQLSCVQFRAFCCVFALTLAGSAFAEQGSAPDRIGPAHFAPSAAAKVEANTLPDASVSMSLSTLGNLSGPMRLTGSSSSGSLSVPLSAREVLKGATLHLVVTNSVSLITERSQLDVRVNDRTIAQLQLSPQRPETAADIRIPPELLHTGYNRLTFFAAQHAEEKCEDPDAPDLWTEIDTIASTLRMQTELLPLTPTLADLGDLIDSRQVSAHSIAMVTASRPQSDLQLENGSLLVQGIALRLRHLPAVPRVLEAQRGTGTGMLAGLALAPLADSDVLLTGTRDALSAYLDASTAARIDGAFVGIYPKPDDPRHFVLVVSGRDDAEVNRAARAFARAELPMPHRSELVIDSLDEASMPPWTGRHIVSGTTPHSLHELGFTTQTLHPHDRADIDIMLPADIYGPEDAQVVFDLNFTEGAKMRPDSVLNIYLNNHFEQVIALDQQYGAAIRHYRVSIPLRSFHAGSNTLSLRPEMVPLVTDRCTLRQTGNLVLTIFDDSTLTLPRASHFTTLPDLERFADSGFPYTAHPDGSELAVRIASRDDDTVAAAWLLTAALAQRQMQPLAAAQLTFGKPLAGRNVIVVGASGALPVTQLAGAPWLPGHAVRLENVTALQDERAGNWLTRSWGGVANAAGRSTWSAAITLQGSTPMSQQLLVMQYRGEQRSTVTVFTAGNAAELRQGIEQLVLPGNWANLDGDIALLTLGKPGLWSARSGNTYEVGTIDTWSWLGFTLSGHPWLGYAVVVTLLALFAGSSSLLLQRHYRNRRRDTGN